MEVEEEGEDKKEKVDPFDIFGDEEEVSAEGEQPYPYPTPNPNDIFGDEEVDAEG